MTSGSEDKSKGRALGPESLASDITYIGSLLFLLGPRRETFADEKGFETLKMMYKMGPCQINQPRKTNPAKALLCSQGLAQRSVSAGKPANLSSGSSVASVTEGKEETAEDMEG